MEAVVEKQEQEIDELRQLLDGVPDREFGKVAEDGRFVLTTPQEHLARSALDRIERAIVELAFFKADTRIKVIMADLQGILDEAAPVLAECIEPVAVSTETLGSSAVIEIEEDSPE